MRPKMSRGSVGVWGEGGERRKRLQLQNHRDRLEFAPPRGERRHAAETRANPRGRQSERRGRGNGGWRAPNQFRRRLLSGAVGKLTLTESCTGEEQGRNPPVEYGRVRRIPWDRRKLHQYAGQRLLGWQRSGRQAAEPLPQAALRDTGTYKIPLTGKDPLGTVTLEIPVFILELASYRLS